jgi:hypothetical protein
MIDEVGACRVGSPSFKLAVEDCLDATFRVFLEDLHRTVYTAAPAPDAPPVVEPKSQDAGDETVEEVRALAGRRPRKGRACGRGAAL